VAAHDEEILRFTTLHHTPAYDLIAYGFQPIVE
jgi:hypothetical protein